MTRRNLALKLVLLCSLALACHRKPLDSPEFTKALYLYRDLYAKSLDDSYTDPRMQRVVELLQAVDPKSLQAPEAQELLEKVQKGIADSKARADRVAADMRGLDAPAKFVGTASPEPLPTPAAPPPPVAASGPSLGMTRDDFTSKYGDCFEKRGDYEQGDRRGEAFGLIASCQTRFPSFADSLVVLIDNRVSSLMPLKEVTVRTVDAGSPPPPPPPAPPPPPTRVKIMPGMPLPAGAVAPAAPPATP